MSAHLRTASAIVKLECAIDAAVWAVGIDFTASDFGVAQDRVSQRSRKGVLRIYRVLERIKLKEVRGLARTWRVIMPLRRELEWLAGNLGGVSE